MARSAIDPKAPFSTEAEPTHWIFVHLEDSNSVVEEICADVMPTSRPSPDSTGGGQARYDHYEERTTGGR